VSKVTVLLSMSQTISRQAGT